MQNVLVTAAENPDLDGVSCALAYRTYLASNNAENVYEAAFQGNLQIEPAYVVGKLALEAAQIQSGEQYDSFILVDACERFGLPDAVRFADVAEVIDHRQFPDYAAFPNAKFRVEPVGAAATQVAEIFYFDEPAHALITPELATLLLCGIYSNTVNFQSDTTTFRDTRMRDWLTGMLPEALKALPMEMFENKTAAALADLRFALQTDVHDDCRQFGPDITAVIYQLELLGSEVIKNRISEVYAAIQELYPNNSYQMLIVQDVENGKTTVFSQNDTMIQRLSKTDLPGKVTADRFELSSIFMRKSVKKALLAVKP